MRMLDECPEMVPTVDYDRVAGNEVWIPEYQRWWALFGVMGLPPDYSSVFGGLPEEGDDYDGEEEDNVVEVVQEEESNVNGSDVGRIPHGLGVVTGSVRVVPEEDQPSAHSDSSSIASPVFFAVKNRKDKGKQRAVASSSPSPPRPPPAIPPTSSTSHPQLPAVVDVLERGNVDEEVLFGPPTVPEQPHFILRQTSSSEDVFESADEEYHE